jgi:predicted dehydrogenase
MESDTKHPDPKHLLTQSKLGSGSDGFGSKIIAQLPGIGVFGTGTAVRCLVPLLKSCGFRVEALWGRTREQAEECAKDLDISFKTNVVDDVLLHRNVDLVFLNCPPHQQTPIAVKALGIGKHVICGMPAGPTQMDALRMVKGAQYYPSLMSLMCNGLRFLPCFVKMKTLIKDGYLGTINICEVRVHCGSIKDKYDWMCDELMGGGVLNQHGSIIIDMITYLTGQKATRVHGLLKTFIKQTDKIKGIRQITSDDFCSFQMELDGGACATVVLNGHLQGKYSHEFLICGSKGHLVARGSDLIG